MILALFYQHTKQAAHRNRQWYRGAIGYRLLCITISLCLALAGCRPSDTPLLPAATPTTVAGDSSQLVSNQATSNTEESGVTVNNGANNERQLVLWTPEFFQPRDETSMVVLEDVYEEFRRNHPGVHLDLQTKAETGESSLFAYLRYAQSIAPTILPDVVLLNTQQLWQAAELGLIQPIPWDQISRNSDFFQFARAAVTFQGQLIGVPYAADIMHLVYRAEQIAQAPTTWEEVMAAGSTYVMAVGKRDYVNESLLLQYVGAGGQLLEDGTMSNPEALTALFTFMTQAKNAGVLSERSMELKSVDESWATFLANEAGFADTSARLVLTQRQVLDNLGFAQIPTRNGAAVTLAHTWAFAILTPDPEQQQLALELIEQLLDPTVHSAWSKATLQLPTQMSAYTAWLDSSPYAEFLQRQLDVAIAIPNGRPFADFARRLQQAQESVLLNQVTVEDAVKLVQGN
jgi:ABC-type glycerol-3-phosphate transport system substrate-binding protein